MRLSTFVTALAVTGAVTAGAAPAEAASAVQFRKIQYNAPGSDTTSNVNGEYAVVKNTATTKRCLTGWTVKDAAGATYTFGSFCLAAGASVYLYTGKGTNTATRRYWGRGWHVWNNPGDKGSLRNSSGTLMDTCGWSSAGSGYVTC